MSKRLTHDLTDEWLEPLFTQRAIRRDLAKFVRSGQIELVASSTERLRDFDRPALVVWSKEDKVMPPDHGRRLVDLLPQGRVDQPELLARSIREFVREPAPAPAAAAAAVQ
jgi:pimeloyl-ACP methyl ester carboxylesterase